MLKQQHTASPDRSREDIFLLKCKVPYMPRGGSHNDNETVLWAAYIKPAGKANSLHPSSYCCRQGAQN